MKTVQKTFQQRSNRPDENWVYVASLGPRGALLSIDAGCRSWESFEIARSYYQKRRSFCRGKCLHCDGVRSGALDALKKLETKVENWKKRR